MSKIIIHNLSDLPDNIAVLLVESAIRNDASIDLGGSCCYYFDDYKYSVQQLQAKRDSKTRTYKVYNSQVGDK